MNPKWNGVVVLALLFISLHPSNAVQRLRCYSTVGFVGDKGILRHNLGFGTDKFWRFLAKFRLLLQTDNCALVLGDDRYEAVTCRGDQTACYRVRDENGQVRRYRRVQIWMTQQCCAPV